jgi:hypothetical protein
MGVFRKDDQNSQLRAHPAGHIYYAARQIAKNLPDMIQKATD